MASLNKVQLIGNLGRDPEVRYTADGAAVANVTIDGVRVAGRKCHYGVHTGEAYGLLAKHIYVSAEVLHSLSFNTASRASVYAHSTVTRAPALDQHSGANHQNLFDDIRVLEDDPEHTFIYPGGAGYWAPTHGAFSTFWNVQVEFLFPLPPGHAAFPVRGVANGASARHIGLAGNLPMSLTWEFGPYIEGLNQPRLAVPSLYEYQLARRLGRPPLVHFDPAAATRGGVLFAADGKAGCGKCHVEPLQTEPGWNLHTPAEMKIDSFQADRAPDNSYRTMNLAGIFVRELGIFMKPENKRFYHDGRFATLLDVVSSYNDRFTLGLSEPEKLDLVEYLKSL